MHACWLGTYGHMRVWPLVLGRNAPVLLNVHIINISNYTHKRRVVIHSIEDLSKIQ